MTSEEPVKAASCLKEIDFLTSFCRASSGSELLSKCRIETGEGLLKQPISWPSEVSRRREQVEQNGALLFGIIPKNPPGTQYRSEVESESAETG